RAAVADVLVERDGTVLGQHVDVEDARVHAVGEREVDDAVLGAEGHRGLGALLGKQAEASADAARQEKRVGRETHRAAAMARSAIGTTPPRARRKRAGRRASLPITASAASSSARPAGHLPSPSTEPSPISTLLSTITWSSFAPAPT